MFVYGLSCLNVCSCTARVSVCTWSAVLRIWTKALPEYRVISKQFLLNGRWWLPTPKKTNPFRDSVKLQASVYDIIFFKWGRMPGQATLGVCQWLYMEAVVVIRFDSCLKCARIIHGHNCNTKTKQKTKTLEHVYTATDGKLKSVSQSEHTHARAHTHTNAHRYARTHANSNCVSLWRKVPESGARSVARIHTNARTHTRTHTHTHARARACTRAPPPTTYIDTHSTFTGNHSWLGKYFISILHCTSPPPPPPPPPCWQ